MPKPKRIKELEDRIKNNAVDFTEWPTPEDIILQARAAMTFSRNAKDLELDTDDEEELLENIFTESADYFMSLYGHLLSEEDQKLFLELMLEMARQRIGHYMQAVESFNDMTEQLEEASKLTMITALVTETLVNWEDAKAFVEEALEPKKPKKRRAKK